MLRNRRLIVGRKQGTSVYYRVLDAQVFELLDIARMLFDRHLLTLQAMAEEDDALRLEASDTTLPDVVGAQRS